MRYVSWAAFYEGPSDALYLDVLLPRLIRDVVGREGTSLVDVPDVPAVRLGSKGRSIEAVTEEACRFRDAFDVVFVHADTGGRGLAQRLANRSEAYCAAFAASCAWPVIRCVTVTPNHETEAWLLADGTAVTSALGYTGDPTEVGLPANPAAAERLVDPKRALVEAVEAIAGRRRRTSVSNLFPAIAQRQRLDILRQAASFVGFEARLRGALIALGCIQ